MPEKSYFIQGSIKPQFIAEQITKHNTKHNIGAHSIFLAQVEYAQPLKGRGQSLNLVVVLFTVDGPVVVQRFGR